MADLTTAEILARIRAKYPPASHSMFTEVRNGGAFATRSCDVMVMSLWQSNGLELHGMEVKASRADWLRELKQPNKSDEFLAVCDRWWLVTCSREIAKLEEIPATWGWLAPRGDGLAVVKKAPKLDALPLDRGTLSSILRRAAEKSSIASPYQRDRFADGVEAGKAAALNSEQRSAETLAQLRAVVSAFEVASGIHINEFTSNDKARKYGALLAALVSATYPMDNVARMLDAAANAMESHARGARHTSALLVELAKSFPAVDVRDDVQVANASKT